MCIRDSSWNYAFNTDVFQWNAPSTMADFFDADKYPGVRSLYSSAMSNLEFALVADGVAGADVYDYMEENGIDRALDKIAELCDHPQGGCIFWSAGAQPPEQLVSGEAVMATGWNGRHFNAIVNEGSPMKMVWDGQVLDYEYFVLVKGGPNQAEAMEALKYFTSSEGLAGSAKHIAYAPFRISSLDIINADEPWFSSPTAGSVRIMPHMPTAPANTQNYVLMNPEWYADNNTEVNDAWEAFKANM